MTSLFFVLIVIYITSCLQWTLMCQHKWFVIPTSFRTCFTTNHCIVNNGQRLKDCVVIYDVQKYFSISGFSKQRRMVLTREISAHPHSFAVNASQTQNICVAPSLCTVNLDNNFNG